MRPGAAARGAVLLCSVLLAGLLATHPESAAERHTAHAQRDTLRAAPVAAARQAANPARAGGGCPRGSFPAGKRPSSDERWYPPVKGYKLTARFASSGERWSHRHTGQDFAVKSGTPVRSVGAGTVVRSSCGGSFGNQIVVRHANGFYTQYAHLSLLQVRKGRRVAPGQQIGLSGNSGNTTGPHLHFEVRRTPNPESATNPVAWLRHRGVSL
ncbi:M23 family metallopeptidase [Streptomyces daliensis]